MTHEESQQYDKLMAEAIEARKQAEIALAEVRMLEVDIRNLVTKDREIATQMTRAFDAVPRAFEAVAQAFIETYKRTYMSEAHDKPE